MKFVENKTNTVGNFLLAPVNYTASKVEVINGKEVVLFATTKFAGKVSKDLIKKYPQLEGLEGKDFSRHEYRLA